MVDRFGLFNWCPYLKYKKEYGEDALWGAFENAEVPYWRSSRSSLFE